MLKARHSSVSLSKGRHSSMSLGGSKLRAAAAADEDDSTSETIKYGDWITIFDHNHRGYMINIVSR